MQTVRGELVNNLGKLSEQDKSIATEETKLKNLSQDDDKRPEIERSLRDLRSEREARLEATSTTSTALRSDISSITDTLNRILTGDTTLAERIKDLFRSEGVTIFSILTALGLAISTLVLALTGGSSGGNGAAASPKPTSKPAPEPSKGGAREWIKNKLTSLGRMLSWLGQKALSALPGLIGTLVSRLFNTVNSAVGFLGENLWALILAIGSLLYLAAKTYITRKSRTEHHTSTGAKKKTKKD